MNARERVNWRFGAAIAATAVAGIAYAVWRSSVGATAARAAAYGGYEAPGSGAYVIGALVVTALVVAVLAWSWRAALRRLAGPRESDPAESLERLSHLRADGALTEDEFQAAKSRVLDGARESRPPAQ